MKLYRNINLGELHSLLVNRRVNPIFDRENGDSTYTSKLGKVTCWFTKPYALSVFRYDFMVIAEIDEKDIIGYGLGEYSREDLYSQVEEIYTRGYTFDDVERIHMLYPFEWSALPFHDTLVKYYDLGLGSLKINDDAFEYSEMFKSTKYIKEDYFLDILYDNIKTLESKAFKSFARESKKLEYIIDILKNVSIDYLKSIETKCFESIV